MSREHDKTVEELGRTAVEDLTVEGPGASVHTAILLTNDTP